MTPLQIAREKVVAASCSLAGNRIYTEVSQPGPHDDAQAELHDEILDQAIGEYYQARMDELHGGDQG